MDTSTLTEEELKEQELIKAIKMGREAPLDTRSFDEIIFDIKEKHLK